MSTQITEALSLSVYDEEDVARAVALLSNGKKVTDAVVYDRPYKKLDPRQRTYYRGWYLRNAIVEADDRFTKKELKVHTVQSGDGFIWVLERKPVST